MVTDSFQFVVEMAGSCSPCSRCESVGGIDAMVAEGRGPLRLEPRRRSASCRRPGPAWLPISTLLVYLGVQWWATWYPGAEPGGGGYVAQRILSAKDERHGLLATCGSRSPTTRCGPGPGSWSGFVGLIRYPASRIPRPATCG